MKTLLKTFLILFICASCAEDEPAFSGKLMVSVEYKYDESESGTYPVGDAIPVYLYEFIDLNAGDYAYVGNGDIKNNANGEIIASIDNDALTAGFVYFKELPNTKYTVVLDMLDSKLKDYRMTSINLANYEGEAEIDFLIDVWPYDPWDLY